MKNVIKSDVYRFSEPSKTSFPGHLKRLIPAAALCLMLIAVPLTGCFEPKPQQTIYKETSDTIASVFSENDAGGTGLPFGVTLQIDPEVLIPCELERVVDGDTIIVRDSDNTLRSSLKSSSLTSRPSISNMTKAGSTSTAGPWPMSGSTPVPHTSWSTR